MMLGKVEVGDMVWTFSTYDDDYPRDLMLVKIDRISIENGTARLHYVWDGRCQSNTSNKFRNFNGEIPNFEGE